jgi:hypothetical protein
MPRSRQGLILDVCSPLQGIFRVNLGSPTGNSTAPRSCLRMYLEGRDFQLRRSNSSRSRLGTDKFMRPTSEPHGVITTL